MEHFLIGGGVGKQKTLIVADAKTADNTGASYGGMDDGNVIGEFGLEDRVKVFGTADGDEAVGVGEGSEDTDIVTVLELTTYCHG